MSAFSGYPAGSKILCEYCDEGYITPQDVKKLAPLCSTCGPLFALGTVGAKAFGDKSAGAKLLFACLFSVTLCWLIFCLICNRRKINENPFSPRKLPAKKSDGNLLLSVFTGGITACLVAGGFICFFYTLSQIFADFKILKPFEIIFSLPFGKNLATGFALGLCEATGGCFTVAAAGGFFALPIAGFLITFGGASIIFQQFCYLSGYGVKLWKFAAIKIIQATLCFAALCLLNLF